MGASQDSERTVLFQKIRNGLSRGQLAPDLFAKLINPERDEELVDDWCETVGREPRMMAYGKRGEFMLTTEFVQAYCWELSLDNVDGQHHAEQAEPAADAKPAEAEDEAEPAPVADAKPAVAEDKPAEQADDNVEPAAAEDAKPAEEGDDKPAEQAEDEAEPPAPEEGEDDQPAAVAEVADAPAPADCRAGAGPARHQQGRRLARAPGQDPRGVHGRLGDHQAQPERRHYRPCRRPLVADEVDPGDLLHQQPAEAGPEEREALGAAKGCFSPGARGLADFACFVAAVFVQGDTNRSGRPPGVCIPLKSLWADSPGVQRAPKKSDARRGPSTLS